MAFWVCGPILPSAVTFSLVCTCLMVSSSCMPPLLPADADAEAPFDCLLDDAPAAAEPCDDLSLEAEDLSPEAPAEAEPCEDLSLEADDPLAAGELALPDALPLADGALELPLAALPEPDCDCVAEGVCPLCDSCFFSCATAPSDSNAAATATAMTLNLMKSPFPGYRSVGLRP